MKQISIAVARQRQDRAAVIRRVEADLDDADCLARLAVLAGTNLQLENLHDAFAYVEWLGDELVALEYDDIDSALFKRELDVFAMLLTGKLANQHFWASRNLVSLETHHSDLSIEVPVIAGVNAPFAELNRVAILLDLAIVEDCLARLNYLLLLRLVVQDEYMLFAELAHRAVDWDQGVAEWARLLASRALDDRCGGFFHRDRRLGLRWTAASLGARLLTCSLRTLLLLDQLGRRLCLWRRHITFYKLERFGCFHSR